MKILDVKRTVVMLDMKNTQSHTERERGADNSKKRKIIPRIIKGTRRPKFT